MIETNHNDLSSNTPPAESQSSQNPESQTANPTANAPTDHLPAQTTNPNQPPPASDPTQTQDKSSPTPPIKSEPAPQPQEPDYAAEAAKFRELAMRTAADFDNFRKRTAREKEEAQRLANLSLLEGILPILDSFELGLQAARSSSPDSPFVKGFEMVKRQLDDFLKNSGVEPIEATGAHFDPNLHEAVGTEFHPEIPEGCVVRQMRRGYKFHDRILRAASVFVSKGPQTQE